MKKFLGLMIFFMRILPAIDAGQEHLSLLREISAANELKELENDIKAKIKNEAQQCPKSVPDFFGIFGECYLPNTFDCCKDTLIRQKFLDDVPDNDIRETLAINWLVYERIQKRSSLLGSKLFAERYNIKISNFIIAGRLSPME